MEQSIEEWTKQNLWKTTFKKFEGKWSNFLKAMFHKILLGPFFNTFSYIWRAVFAKIINGFYQLSILVKNSIIDVRLSSEYTIDTDFYFY